MQLSWCARSERGGKTGQCWKVRSDFGPRFRTSPHDGHFSQAMFDFMRELEKRRNVKIKSVAIMHEATQFGSDSAKVQEELAKKAGYEVVAKITYRDKATNLDAEVGKLKAANADVQVEAGATLFALTGDPAWSAPVARVLGSALFWGVRIDAAIRLRPFPPTRALVAVLAEAT